MENRVFIIKGQFKENDKLRQWVMPNELYPELSDVMNQFTEFNDSKYGVMALVANKNHYSVVKVHSFDFVDRDSLPTDIKSVRTFFIDNLDNYSGFESRFAGSYDFRSVVNNVPNELKYSIKDSNIDIEYDGNFVNRNGNFVYLVDKYQSGNINYLYACLDSKVMIIKLPDPAQTSKLTAKVWKYTGSDYQFMRYKVMDISYNFGYFDLKDLFIKLTGGSVTSVDFYYQNNVGLVKDIQDLSK